VRILPAENKAIMKRILVTTDLSKNSKAGLRFAIQLASQYKVRLVFFNTLELLIPTRWNDVKAKIHMDEELAAETENLKRFVSKVYKETGKRPGEFECVVRYGAPVSHSILEYAAEINASFICMATRGAGELKKLLGTHTSAVIKQSSIPVFAIPKTYKVSAIKALLYASDLNAVRQEFGVVKALAQKLESKVSIVHYVNDAEDDTIRKSGVRGISLRFEKWRDGETISKHLKRTARTVNADVVALFTDQGRSWFDRLFHKSRSADASLESSKPVLVYAKK
jgi:nucleotide-binding universal stress UspA family protein